MKAVSCSGLGDFLARPKPAHLTADLWLHEILLRHAQNVKASVNADDFAGGVGARVGGQVNRRATDRLQRGVAAHGR